MAQQSKPYWPEFLRPAEAIKFLGIGRTLFLQLSERDPDFPPKIILTPRCVGWHRESLSAWLKKKEKGGAHE